MGSIFQRAEAMVAAVSAISSGASFLLSAVDFAAYILFGIACLQLANKLGVPYGWRGFVPFANRWLLGRLSDVGKPRGNTHWLLLALYIGKEFFSVIYRLLGGVSRIAKAADRFLDVTVPATLEEGLGMAVLFRLLGYACGIGYTVILCMGYYRLAKNFGRESYAGYCVLLVLGVFVNPIASVIALLLLSRKEPAVTASGTAL